MIIECADCGSEYETKRRNAKYCGFHRFWRDIRYARQQLRTQKCPICDSLFVPWITKQSYCGACMVLPETMPKSECAYCHETTAQVHKDVRICPTCVTNPKNNIQLLKNLAHKDRELRAHPTKLESNV